MSNASAGRTMVSVSLPSQIPLAQQAQVIVVGGGPGGIGAAVAAARQGADVLLVEHYGFLGGMATAGEVNPFMPNHLNGKSLDTGIFEEWVDRMSSYGGVRPGSRVFDPHIARLAAEDLCVEAGVRLLYHHRAVHVETADRRIETVVLHSKGGLTAARADIWIDSTGDGDLAALAGCEFHFGSETSGHAQPMTLCFKLKLNRNDLPEDLRDQPAFQAIKQFRQQIEDAYQRGKQDGRIECPRENVLLFPSVEDDVIHFNTTRVIRKSAVDGRQLSEAEIEARRQLRQIWKVLADEVPIFRNSRIYSIAPQIGVRESRRIVGRAWLTLEDYQQARTFEDAVARVTYPVDIHNPDGTGTHIVHLPKGKWYEIPWGCLLPKDIDNMAIASRCISADHAVHSSLRVMPPVCSIGQAAGTAAGMAIRNKIDVCQVDGRELRQNLIAQGRHLGPEETPTDGEETPAQQAARVQRSKAAAKTFSA